MGDVFAGLAVREPQPRASEAFRLFGEQHRSMEKFGQDMVKKIKPVLADMGTYLYKAIPDTRLTVKKYADAKFEYLAYCLKVKEMDDEECSYAALQEPLYRVETGNYEYRSDVLVKMELLDNKHVQSLGGHLTKLIKGLSEVHTNALELFSGPALFPVEVDLSNSAFQYKSTTPVVQQEVDEEDQEIENGEEVHELEENLLSELVDSTFDNISENDPLIAGLDRNQPEPNYDEMDNLTLLASLNIHETPKNNVNGPLLPDLNE
ncbi:hypothetical protein GEV33_006118 [Tenebrio molitor]|uniref:AH domain-containing protein n=1 Tax=Tenebrio molitor TaxID=7067 RepID=A0A8J6HLW4_TENMO|nr:hypothetical protein GEV33_006118 [Tenebrio molitor]